MNCRGLQTDLGTYYCIPSHHYSYPCPYPTTHTRSSRSTARRYASRGAFPYDGETLFHGPMLRGIASGAGAAVSAAEDRCSVRLSASPLRELSRGDMGCFAPCAAHGQTCGGEAKCADGSGADAFDPFAADLVMQAMLVWAREIAGTAALPGDGLRIEFLRPVPRAAAKGAIVTMTRTQGSCKDDVWRASFFVHAENGTVYMRGDASVVLSAGLAYELGGSAATAAAARAPAVAVSTMPATPTTHVIVTTAAPAGASIEVAKTIILEEVSEATGYSVEMIDEEMSLEEELGIDS